ncbi:hypothetical protein OO012_09415 [Rhodobacteraceae bacterium KMM 6894]|nr:hypothetical protein [Rhodobacteraceae bacterium KMM 6894]
MTRFALIAVLLSCSAPAFAGKTENCAATAGIVRDAVAQRADGKDMTDTVAFLGSDAGGVAAKYREAVPALVDWVYTLPADQLTDAAPKAFEDACLAHES